ncbi:phosphoglycerate mutase-like protein [Abortiporus biennis]|nr:phosphoglycerate mutase-like protein [Abortiporus biennis]
MCFRKLTLSLVLTLPLVGYAFPTEKEGFNLVGHLGNLSPYQKAPVPNGIKEELPGDCKVEQVMLMHRHGSRFPLASELPFITNLVSKLSNHSSTIQKLKLEPELEFLKSGYVSTLGHDDLTGPGRKQLFDHGVAFRLNYPDLQATSILAGLQDRVVESAQWFAEGYFGRSWSGLNSTVFSTIPEDSATPSWITPSNTCKGWQYAFGNNLTIEWGTLYIPPITKRLNKLLPGVNLTNDDIHGALYACAYDLAAHGVSPWCNAFEQSEILDFEYELDLLMVGAFGYDLPGKMGPVLGALFVDKLIQRFTDTSSSAQQLYLEFGHDTTIDFALTALGFAKDTPLLSAKGPVRANRKWRTSTQVPFAAQMVWEKFTCSSSFKGPQIRLLLNESPFPLSTCKKMDRKLGSCALNDFVEVNKASTSISWGDSTWNSTCGN